MPIVPKGFLDCVVYLYPDKASAECGRNVGGTGFTVGVESKTRKNALHLYVVSCYHAAVRDGNCVVRFNASDGGIHIVELDSSEWLYVPNGGDVAAVQMPRLPAGVRPSHVHLSMFADPGDHQYYSDEIYPEPWCNLNVGDDVFMLGRFFDADGIQTNKPAARFGNLSILPSHIPGIVNSDATTEYYCLDMHSRTGFSGSPVFAYRTAASRIEMNPKHIGGPLINHLNVPFCKFLGIHCGQFPEEMRPKGDSAAKPLIGYSGMTYVLPAWKVLDLVLRDSTFSSRRTEIDKALEGMDKQYLE
jgi:hypothetical protein